MWILVVEPERSSGRLVREGLEEEGHSVVVAHGARKGLEVARTAALDAIILDNTPDIDGSQVVRRLRLAQNHTPILMLVAADSLPDIVEELDPAADDFATKPLNVLELGARLRAITRRRMAPPVRLQVNDLVLDTGTCEVSRNDRKIALSPTEFRLLELLMRRAGRVVARGSIIDTIWGSPKGVRPNTVDAFVRLLRSKIDAGEKHKLIHTVRGFGYCLRGCLRQGSTRRASGSRI